MLFRVTGIAYGVMLLNSTCMVMAYGHECFYIVPVDYIKLLNLILKVMVSTREALIAKWNNQASW